MMGGSNLTDRPIARRALTAARAACLGLTLLCASPALAASASPHDPKTAAETHADFQGAAVSSEARQVADWIVQTRDNAAAPFIIVDKKATMVFAFDGQAHLLGATPALLGLARGDDSAPGVGDRKLADIRPEERTTPAGRFVASLGLNLSNQDILWIDYKTAIALHRVLDTNTAQHRLERLAGPTLRDRRITFGCINVPVKFYEDIVAPAFAGRTGVVYILPETRSVEEVFFGQVSPPSIGKQKSSI